MPSSSRDLFFFPSLFTIHTFKNTLLSPAPLQPRIFGGECFFSLNCILWTKRKIISHQNKTKQNDNQVKYFARSHFPVNSPLLFIYLFCISEDPTRLKTFRSDDVDVVMTMLHQADESFANSKLKVKRKQTLNLNNEDPDDGTPLTAGEAFA